MLRSRQNLEIGEWTTISINRNTETQECKLSVNNETPIRSIENGNMHALELKTHLFVGGYDSYKVKIAKSVEVESNFKGCIKMVTLIVLGYLIFIIICKLQRSDNYCAVCYVHAKLIRG